MKTAFVFGGSGYIAFFLINKLIEEHKFDKIILFDIKKPLYFNSTLHNSVEYIYCDVRNKIEYLIDFNINTEESWIYNFAAIHREPGHDRKEYFDTNINGAENINEFAERLNVKNIFFTSSIAPYGKSKNVCTEESMIYAETPYGISKGLAEKIHQIWLAKSIDRRLIIVRPSVIYGPHDPGNIYRTIKALKKGAFMLPNGGNIIKAYGYVFGLIESILFTMNQNERLIIYNYAENPIHNLKEMIEIIKKELGYKKPTFSIPVSFLVIVAGILQIGFKMIGKKSDIHPVRVKKAAFPTNIKPNYLIDKGFKFNYGLKESLRHWKSIAPKDFD
ncbi:MULTISPECIES: NAD(P)-dependent oxidoreductase [unclassified Empedobacter]|uniref:NAD-dependent epimerase/dehydratase family protein n=1 Tax=unclassified Empedobacter TaxID=2643773 RepID=UPI0024496C04|nr:MULTISPECIES: NAD(P)-dependent oxidoreductase [unclassified Empedobacter]MDH0660730.1 NAD(P)-dependent oxidoreductase [Empedobacter sp. GD03865]MDH0673353.1 NAD(P)-dependent oxidoreductase [Empedobacter sp. GD03861]